MSKADLFSKYSQVYARAKAKEIVPDGPFVRQLTDMPHAGLDVGLFFKAKKDKNMKQVYVNGPIPEAVAKKEGFLEAGGESYLSRTLLSDAGGLQFLRLVVSAGELLESREARLAFLKKVQRIVDMLVRKARNVVHSGTLDPFRFDRKVKTLQEFLTVDLKLDEVAVEAASIPFMVAAPQYILLSNQDILVTGEEYRVPHSVFHLVGGIGYTFDNRMGAVHEERLFRTTTDLAGMGITESYIDSHLRTITSDFQNNLHSVIFSDVWKKSPARPAGVNFGGDLLIKTESTSDIWSGVFEVYIRQPS
ncbi:MAG: hypothetical protein HXY34_00700 [Candidatus Thorarchaeota archaeon]|nr:hypothetical protein [Candidatus Thorarchaeota archaeon]